MLTIGLGNRRRRSSGDWAGDLRDQIARNVGHEVVRLLKRLILQPQRDQRSAEALVQLADKTIATATSCS